MHLYWGARAKVDLYLDELPRRWVAEHMNFRYTPVLSALSGKMSGRVRPVGCMKPSSPTILIGYAVFYMSGPPPMIEAARPAFVARGLPVEQLFYDSFEFAPR